MNTLNDTKIILNTTYSLFLLAILGLGIMIAPAETKAEAYGSNVYLNGNDSRNYNQNYYNNNQNYYQAPAPVVYTTPPSVTPTIYTATVNKNAVASAPKTVAKAKNSENKEVANAPEEETYSSLAANAIFGTNSILPSGLTQWIIFAIFVLLATILVRKVYGGSEKYHATPMKHN